MQSMSSTTREEIKLMKAKIECKLSLSISISKEKTIIITRFFEENHSKEWEL